MLRRRCPICARVFAGSERFCPHDAAALVDVEVEDARIGSVVAGRYRIGAELGRGGMGVVYRAEQLPMERPVAVKILRRDGDGTSVERFMREARAMSALQSPHSVRLYDFGEAEDGALYLVMELLVGESLRDRLARGPLPVAEAIAVLDEVARSLAEAHLHRIVHRDLTPANVFLCDAPGQPRFAKVLDFGIASLPWGDQQRLTRTSELPGTPAYVAPERVSGEGAGPPADVYALGVLAYEMLTGAPPFEGETAWDVLMAHLTEEPEALADRVPEGVAVPPALEELVWRCLAKSPELRPPDAGAFREALAAVGREGAARGEAAGPPPTRGGGWRRGLAVAAALLLGATAGWLVRDGRDLEPAQPTPVIAPAAAADHAPVEAVGGDGPEPAAGEAGERVAGGEAPAAAARGGEDDAAAPVAAAPVAAAPVGEDDGAAPVAAAPVGEDDGAAPVAVVPAGEDDGAAPVAAAPGDEDAAPVAAAPGDEAARASGAAAAAKPDERVLRPPAPSGGVEGDDGATATEEAPGAHGGPDPLLIERLLGEPPPR